MTARSINGALAALVFNYGELTAQMAAQGITFQIADYGGLRTRADTTTILKYRDDDWNAAVRSDPTLPQRTTKESWRPIAQWGSSMHNYGAAFDVEVLTTPPGMSRLTAMNVIHDAAEDMGMVSGRRFGDSPHIELGFPGAPPGAAALAAAKTAWLSENGTDFFRR